MTSPTPQPDKPSADAVSVAATEVNVTGENVNVAGQDEVSKKKELAAVAGLAKEAVNLEDRKKADAIKEAASTAKEERKEEADERREIRVIDDRTAADIRTKEFKKIMLGIILAAIPTTLLAATGAYISYRDAAVNRSTHELVNSGNLTQLQAIAGLAHWKAEQTRNESDIMAAIEADKRVAEHIAKQKAADAKAGK